MGKWTIYDKDGNVRHESITEWEGDGSAVRQDTLEYSGTWMGECFVTLSVKSPYPIDFQIGDYIVYRGETFTIDYDPSVIKKARRGSYGEGFTYDNIKFNSPNGELAKVPFHDVVLSSNELHYTSLPNFSFYAKDVDDLVDRLQANMNEWCRSNGFAEDEYWMFYTLASNPEGTDDEGQTATTYERTLERARDISSDADFLASVESEWKRVYGEGSSYADSREDELYDRSISVDNQTVWDGMSMIKRQFGLNFIIRGRNVYVGTAGVPTDHVFKYGKGNGLYEIEKNADTGQKVVTKLHAYGSGDNLPSRYYASLGEVPGAVVKGCRTEYNGATMLWSYRWQVVVSTGLVFDSRNYTTKAFLANTYMVYAQYGNTEDIQFAVREDDNGYAEFFCDGLTSALTAKEIAESISKAGILYLTGNVRKGTFRDADMYNKVQDLPDNMVVNTLMLPGFPSKSLAELCSSEYDDTADTTSYYITNPTTKERVLFHSEEGKHIITYSSDRHNPYLLSQNAASLGVLPGDIHCNEDNDDNGLEKVYPTIEGMTDKDAGTGSTGARLDKVSSADKVTDNGIWEGQEIPNFHIVIPHPGFDVRQAAEDAGGDSMEISMKSGFCAARSFKVGSVSQNTDGTWDLVCQRVTDSSLGLTFPYSYAANTGSSSAAMTDAYQVCAGDRFVFTGLYIDDLNYVWAASVRLLRKAIHWLCKNDYTRYVYRPKIDEIYMARQAETAAEAGTESLHDSIKEGGIMLFEDEDLGIEGSVYIEKLTIKENGNNDIPTYDVTLRDDTTVGTIQRIQNQISSIKNDLASGNMSGVVSAGDVERQVRIYGQRYFIKKKEDDTASGTITFEETVNADGGVAIGTANGEGIRPYAVKADGSAVLGDVQAKGNLSVSGTASVEGTATFGSGSVPFISGAQGCRISVVGDGMKIQTDYLEVTRKMTAHEIEVMKTSHIGGRLMNTAASMICSHVETLTDTDGTPTAYVCFFEDTDSDGRQVDNLFREGDQALCQTFNIKEGTTLDFSNQYYWRLVTAVSYTPAEDITTSGTTYVAGVEIKNCIVLSATDCATGSTVPMEGDEIVQLGNRTDADRQGAIIQSSTGTAEETPYMRCYKGINSYTLPEPFFQISPEASWINATEVVIKSTGQSGVTIEQYFNGMLDKAKEYTDAETTEAKTYTDTEVGKVSDTLSKVEEQLDESFYVYHGEDTTVPTLDNLPASEWKTEEMKAEHVGDFYVASDGFCWQFRQDSSYNYVWAEVNDRYLTAYVQQIGEKKRVFTARPTKDAAYDVGDLWANASYDGTDSEGKAVVYSNDMLVCITAKAKGDDFSIDHWQASSCVTAETVSEVKVYADSLWAGSTLQYTDGSGTVHTIEKSGLVTTSNMAALVAENAKIQASISAKIENGISTANIRADQVEILSDHFKVLGGDVYADSLTLTGTFNNMLTEVDADDIKSTPVTCQLDGSPTLYGAPDWLCTGQLVHMAPASATSINLPFYTCTPDHICAPSGGEGSEYRYVRTPTRFGTGTWHMMTLAEMRMMVGKTFYITNKGMHPVTVYYGVPFIFTDGDTPFLQWDGADDYASIGIPAGATLIVDCRMDGYLSGGVYYECIWWRYRQNVGQPLLEFKTEES